MFNIYFLINRQIIFVTMKSLQNQFYVYENVIAGYSILWIFFLDFKHQRGEWVKEARRTILHFAEEKVRRLLKCGRGGAYSLLGKNAALEWMYSEYFLAMLPMQHFLGLHAMNEVTAIRFISFIKFRA